LATTAHLQHCAMPGDDFTFIFTKGFVFCCVRFPGAPSSSVLSCACRSCATHLHCGVALCMRAAPRTGPTSRRARLPAPRATRGLARLQGRSVPERTHGDTLPSHPPSAMTLYWVSYPAHPTPPLFARTRRVISSPFSRLRSVAWPSTAPPGTSASRTFHVQVSVLVAHFQPGDFYPVSVATCPALASADLPSHSFVKTGCAGGPWGDPCVLGCQTGFNSTGDPHYPCTKVCPSRTCGD